ncbi:MAG: DEAD/DEAH box helicase [Gammaproteobacteria bacterium]
MSYFSDHYHHLTFPQETPEAVGFRNAQLGALHAVASHFTLHRDPAVIVMPTGSGKTAVLMAAAFLLRAERVLVVSPSRLVRNQIAAEWKELRLLKEIGALPPELPLPSVAEVTSQLASMTAWQELAYTDVIVGTPRSVSPAIEGVTDPPPNFFDLMLIDEAHHSPAKTWNALLAAFPEASRVLFTATPFRQDRREIKGRFAYVYPVARAFEDGIFGRVEYIPVLARERVDHAIARQAEQELRSDQKRGLSHYLFVRTDSKKRAEELRVVYDEATELSLQVIHSGYSLRFINRTIKALRNGELDGIICVDMLGEGFDLPNLKIAAVHKPHKSLAVTLQFIGRFARTNAPDIGNSKFLAAPADIRIQAERLFREGAVWQDLIIGMGDNRVRREVALREQLDTFQRVFNIEDVTEDLSLYSLRPYHHVKVLRTEGDVDIHTDIELPYPYEIIHREVSDDLGVAVFITRETRLPRWTKADQFSRVEYDLFVIYWDADSQLLFMCASRRQEPLYNEIAAQYSPSGVRRLPLNVLNRVLRPYKRLEFYNVGMRHRAGSTESYRIITGSAADRAIRPSDGRFFHQGHAFGGTSDENGLNTIGLSSASKIWSNRYSQIPDIVDWCTEIAADLIQEDEFRTFSGLDHLPLGKETRVFTGVPIAAVWDRHTLLSPPLIQIVADSGEVHEVDLMECDLRVEPCNVGSESVDLLIEVNEHDPLRLRFGPTLPPRLITGAAEIDVIDGDRVWTMTQYFSAYPPHVFQADFSSVHGSELLPGPGDLALMIENLETEDWAGQGVDIQREFGAPSPAGTSIHSFLEDRLHASGSQIVFYDHGPGELGDFLAVTATDDTVTFSIYHCKSSTEPQPGRRVNDAYEVCGQVAKTAPLIGHAEKIYSRVAHRSRTRTESRFISGSLEELRGLVDLARARRSEYEVVLFQPGISAAAMHDAIRDNLAAAGDFIRSANGLMRVILSP